MTSRNGATAKNAANTGVTKDDYKQAMEGKKALTEKIAENRAVNPNYQLSPEEQDMWNMYDAVEKRQLAEFAQRNGINQQKQAQRNKVDFNDYYSLKPAIDNLIKQRGGKFDAEIARFIRHRAGIGADNKDPNEFVNQIFEKTYGFRG